MATPKTTHELSRKLKPNTIRMTAEYMGWRTNRKGPEATSWSSRSGRTAPRRKLFPRTMRLQSIKKHPKT